MILYVIHRMEVYRQECGGIFETRQQAEDVTGVLICGEPDDYHTYEIRPQQVGYATPRDPNSSCGSLEECAVLTRFKRNDKRTAVKGKVIHELEEVIKEVLIP